MKSSYEIRAQKFVMLIAPYLIGCKTPYQFEEGVHNFLIDHSNRRVRFNYGISRVAMITSDYVIKIDYNTRSNFGTCASELENYYFACQAGYGEYFAKITRFTYMDRDFYIMPKISNIDEEDDDAPYKCDDELAEWLDENFYDLHSGNYGWKDGHIVIFDYAAAK